MRVVGRIKKHYLSLFSTERAVLEKILQLERERKNEQGVGSGGKKG